jgi:hypothetical protein
MAIPDERRHSGGAGWFLRSRSSFTARRGKQLTSAAMLATALVSAILLLHSAYFTWKYFTITPFWDCWNWIADYQIFKSGHYTLHDLLKPHNEHRIVTTRLVLLADAVWGHMTGRLVVVLNFALLAALGASVALCALGRRRVSYAALAYTVASVAWMTSVCQWPNLIVPFQIQFALLCVSLVATAISLAKATHPDRSRASATAWACLAGAGALSATFSMAGGLLTLPPLLLMLLLRRARVLPAAVFSLIAAASAFLFLHDYHPVTAVAQRPPADPRTIVALLKFAAGFIGNAVAPLGRLAFALGFCGLALYAFCFAVFVRAAVRRNRTITGRMLALFTIAGAVVLMAAAAAVSRLSLGISASLEPRYATLSLLFWACMAPLSVQVWRLFGGAAARRWPDPGPLALASAMLALGVANLAPRYAGEAMGFDNNLIPQGDSLRAGVLVPQLFGAMVYGTPAEASSRLDMLRTNHLSVFARGAGAPPPPASLLATIGTTQSVPCSGSIDYAYRLDRGRAVIRAWLAAPQTGRMADWVALVEPDGSRVAIISANAYHSPVHVGRFKIHAARGVYAGFVVPQSAASRSSVLRAFGLFANAQALSCELPVPIDFGPFRIQPVKSIDKVRPIPGAAQVASAGFEMWNASKSPHLAAPFTGESVFALTNQAKSGGRIAFAVTPDATDDLVVPFTAGPDTDGENIEARFADGADVVQPIPEDTEAGVWRALALPHDEIARHGGIVTIIAREQDSQRGQWMAVATPVAATLDPDWAKLY